MLRGFRHTLFWFLQIGVIISGGVALLYDLQAWQAVAICVLGSVLASILCERIARRYLQTTLGRLRRAADDIGHGREATTMDAQPGDDFYKLVKSINLVANRLAASSQEEKRLQDQLRRRERLAFLGELAATVAHEVNNPLDGVQNCTRILRRSLNDPQRAAQMLDLIDGGLSRIELIVRRLLTLAREHVIRPVEFSLGGVIDRALEVVGEKLSRAGIRVSRQFEANDDRARVDPQLLEQVFVNLLLNAADSMPDGGEIRLVIRRGPTISPGEAAASRGAPSSSAPPPRFRDSREDPRAAPGNDDEPSGDADETDADAEADDVDTLIVDVIDSGAGIAPDVLPHIFEPFFTTKAGGKGTGLGLAIAARIIDAHQGRIEVASRPGVGTTFRIHLPAAVASSAPVRPPAEPVAESKFDGTA